MLSSAMFSRVGKVGAAFGIVLIAPVVGQGTDVSGWQGALWGASRPAVMKALQALPIHECRAAAGRSCSDTRELVIENYRAAGVAYGVAFFFSEKNGFFKVQMTAADNPESFRKALADLTARYGKPGLRSEYDGARESARTIWTWVKAHGSVSLEADDAEDSTGEFTITYEAR